MKAIKVIDNEGNQNVYKLGDYTTAELIKIAAAWVSAGAYIRILK